MYLTPLVGAYIADSYLGRYKTILYSAGLYLLGIAMLFATSFHAATRAHAGLPGLIITIIFLGLGTGGFKPNIGPLLLDQYPEKFQRVKTLKSGERVIVDPQITITNIMYIYFNLALVGCLSGIPTTWLALKVGFWAAFLLPLCVFVASILLLVSGGGKYVEAKPEPVLGHAFKAVVIAIRHGGKMDAAKPSALRAQYGASDVPYDDEFVEELKRGFIPQPIAYLCYLQATNNLISQAATMETHGLPNDILYNFTLLFGIVNTYLIRAFLIPFLRRKNIPFGPVRRMTTGFICGATGISYAAIVQKIVYSAGPCYDAPLNCPASEGGRIPNQANVMLQLPVYLGLATFEVLVQTATFEYAYTKAPKRLKGFVTAMVMLTTAVASALGIAVSRTAYDPGLITMYACLGGAFFASTILLWYFFRNYDKLENDLFALDVKVDAARAEKEKGVHLE
ncbi:peptide transporter ptr2 [Purpureocillium takamizusanense]|uniref:Peptide transporter ptr2 n=1 Tax=Purpureocillium takamizusanense TaxID=2060973 RepID=A0A9Q8QDF3_9HYPO|nr:peptide transporter ptr2 [Purpureocillium takamizusanense]UNI17171.1 peptide transporter ptr2 [Purpureocillium takamizusanense]